MYERNYYRSSYVSEKRENPAPAHKKKMPRLQKIGILAGVIIAVILFFVWLFLGPFRFMFWRYSSFTGFPFGTRTYLVLFQNNYELRPTGGFISTYGILKFSHGVYAGIDFYDVYGTVDDHPYAEPPLVLATLLKNDDYAGHTFRDANFDPDFRVSKAGLIDFYSITNPDTRVDGIFAADFSFLETLVGLYEPLSVDGHELTKQNLFETLTTISSDVDRHSETALANRKNITSPIVQKIITKTLILPWRVLNFLDVLAKGFEEKHVLAAFNRNGIQNSFHSRGWDGALPQSDLGDFLAVNEANYGGMKSDRYMTRDVQYELNVSNQRDVLGNPIINATVTVTLSHEGGYDIPMSGPYTGYARTMIPLGSDIKDRITTSLDAPITEDREDVYVLGEIVKLNPGESVSYTYSYELPEYVWSNKMYYLHLHKQPGTDGDRYRIIVHAPQGMSLDAPGFTVRENTAFYETNLYTDQNLEFALTEDNNPPRLVSQEFTADNEITIVFNEPLNVDHAADPGNYKIVDLNYADAAQTDTVAIKNIQVDGSAVIITTAGINYQSGERYEITLQGLTDNQGNLINPSPRTLTVVQNGEPAVLSPTDNTTNTTETTNE